MLAINHPAHHQLVMVVDKLNAPERCVLLRLGLAGLTLAEDIQTRQNLPWRLKLLRTYEHDF